MKSAAAEQSRRPYRQGARAAAAEATGERILAAFMERLKTQWFDEITLEAVARDAEVTLQTVIRRFGGKTQLLQAASDHMASDIIARRVVLAGDVDHALAVLLEDYEITGDLVLRWLDQEERHPALRIATDRGRSHHRQWVGEVFAPWLDTLAPAVRETRLDGLVVATDLYVWKLVRKDMGRPPEAFVALSRNLIAGVLDGRDPTRKA